MLAHHPGMTGLYGFDRKFFGHLACWKTSNVTIIGIVLSGLGRTKRDKFGAFGPDNNRQVIAVNGG